MARANLPVPETISGERSLGTPYTDLQVKARPTSGEYMAPTAQHIPNAPTENALGQLADAMSKIQPSLTAFAAQQVKYREDNDAAEARAAYERNLRTEYADAVKKGLIPAGASRAYIEAYKGLELDTKTQRFGMQLHQEYEASGLKDVDDPKAMEKFINEFTGKFRQAALMREGADRYTPREINNSKFDEKLNGYTQSLLAQHIQYRTDERTKQGKETAQTNAGLKIDSMFDSEFPESHAATAKAIMDSFYDPRTGIAMNGVTSTEANKLMVDVITSKMVQYGDAKYAEIAKHITTHGNSKLFGTQYARTKFKEASDAIITEQIRNSNWDWQRRERRTLEEGGLGPEEQAQLKIAEKEHQKKAWEHTDKMNAHALRMAGKSDDAAEMAIRTSSHVSNILTGISGKDMSNPRVARSMEWLKLHDPDKYMSMVNWLNAHKKEAGSFADSPSTELAAARLRFDMSQNPLAFQPTRIIEAANNGLINPNKVQPLMDDWDKQRIHLDNPFLQNSEYQRLVGKVTKAALKGRDAEYGPGALDAINAEHQMRTNAYNWIESNPKGNYLDFIKAMTAQAEPMIMDFSESFAEEESAKLQNKQNPKPVPQKDTRSFMEKVTPNALGGKSKPEPVTPEPQGPPPMKASEAFNAMKPESQAIIRQLLTNPDRDDMELEAAIYNSGLWAFMKSNGRSVAEFKALKDQLVQTKLPRK